MLQAKFSTHFIPNLSINLAFSNTMAELLGTVASGIGVAEFALTVGESMSKLRRLWENVQEAPETIAAGGGLLVRSLLLCLRQYSF